MMRHICLAIALSVAMWTNQASAQYVPPGGPTLPVELEYFRPQQGVLDQYNQFVAPRQQLANQLRNLDQRQTAEFRALDRQLRETERIRQSQAAPTGVAATFMNYSHYYGTRAASGPRGAVRRPGR
jgi:hypothetical protein